MEINHKAFVFLTVLDFEGRKKYSLLKCATASSLRVSNVLLQKMNRIHRFLNTQDNYIC